MSDIDYTAILPDGWGRARGFSYAVRSQGSRLVHVAGQVAARDGNVPVSEGMDFGGQWDVALGNVVTLVQAAGGAAANIVTMRVYVTDIDAFQASGAAVGAAWGKHLGKHFPAMTLVEVSRLINPHAMVEIEAEAVLP